MSDYISAKEAAKKWEYPTECERNRNEKPITQSRIGKNYKGGNVLCIIHN